MERRIQTRQLADSISANQSWKIGAWKTNTSQFIHVEVAEYFCHNQSPIHLFFLYEYLRPKYPCYMPIVIGPQLQLFLTIFVLRTPYTAEISVELAKRNIRRLDPDLDVLVPEI